MFSFNTNLDAYMRRDLLESFVIYLVLNYKSISLNAEEIRK